MGDDTKSNRRAMSLNDRHYRFLQDLSAPPKPSFNLIDDDEVEEQEELLKMKVEEGRRLLERESARETQDAHRDAPSFSGIIDFDSPSPEVEKEVKKTAKVEIEGRHSICELSSRDACNPIADNELKEEEEQRNVKVEERCHLSKTESTREPQDAHHDVPSFSGITDFDSSPEVEKEVKKMAKVEIEGRHSICELSSRDACNTIADNELKEEEEQRNVKVEERCHLSKTESTREPQDAHHDVPSFSGITDFDSSPEVEKEVKKTAKVEIEGRHSICELSSRDACNTIADNELKEEEEQRNVKVEERCHLSKTESTRETQDAHHDVPSFSGITDFDSSPEVEKEVKKTAKVEIEGRHSICELSSRDACNTIADNELKEEEEQRNVKVEERCHLSKTESTRETQDAHHDVPSFSGITDFDSSPGVEKYDKKAEKVMIEGRRRLCKLSSRDACNMIANAQNGSEATFFDVPDFDSPLPSKSQNNAGAGEIRDILSDLTSMLDLLSIEKKRAPARSESVAIGISSSHRVGYPVKKVDVPEYESAESSFSPMSVPSDTLSDGSQNRQGGVMDADMSDEEEGEDDCMVLSRPKCNMDVAKKVDTGKYHVEEESDVQYEHEGDNRIARVCKTHGLKKKEPKRVNEKFRYNGRSFVPNLRDEDGDKEQEEDDDEDGCLVLRGLSSTFNLPSAVAKILYPHQCEGLKWLWSLHCQGKGGILGDDMGLGKTMQICGFLAGLFHSRLIKRALIVAPKTLLPHWIKELSVVGLSSKTREYFGTNVAARTYELQYVLQDKGILLTTYDIVRNNSKSLQGDAYLVDEESEDGFTWDYMILDEGHLIKNPSTQRAKSLLEISCAHRIIISGTPIQNNLKELWALFNFCCPGLLGDNKQFKVKFEHAILRGNEKKASDRDKRVGSAAAKELRERIQPYFLRRLKTEVFNDDNSTTAKLSKKNEIIVWLKLTSCQRELYEAFLNSELVLSAFDGSPLAALTILKKICDHPLLLTKRAAEDLLEGMESMLNPEEAGVAERLAMHLADVAERTDFQEKHDNISCKLSFILSLLDNLIPEGHNVLIFSQTRKMLNHIQESLSSNGYEFLRIDGTTKASDRLKIVNDFQEDARAPPIFLLTSQVGGLGLTLTKADRVIVVDPAWNPSTDNQSVDRAYRIGQTKDVLVYRLMTCGTVEEKIYRKQVFKGGLFKTATEQKEQIRYFSQQDLQELFSLPAQGFNISVTQQQLYEEHDSQHKMNEFLQGHLHFLETLGIAGVSHHSLLFSKTAPVQVEPDEEKENRNEVATFAGHSSSSYTLLHDAEGSSQYAFNPKDVKLNRKSSSPNSVVKLTESEIKDRINRLSRLIGNQVMVSRLPDKGLKIKKQISELKSELHKMRMETATEREVIDLDDLTGELARVSELKSELHKMRMETATKREVIDLDDLTGELARVLNV